MTIYVVSKTLYGKDVVDDLGYRGCSTEIIGAFLSEDYARDLQEDTMNASDLNIYPYEGEADPDETYIDVVLEEVEVGE